MSAALPTPPLCPTCGATTQVPGPQGPAGAAGPAGPAGAAGPQGPAGVGNSMLGGAGVPGAGLGNTGDWYFNTANGDVYQKTGPAVWTFRFNTVGPSGSSSAIQVSTGVPNNGTGNDGDWDLDNTSGNGGDWYHKETGAWVLKYTNTIPLASRVTGTLGHAHGGTDAVTLQAAVNGMIPGANGDVVIRAGGNVTTLANPADASKVLVGTNPPTWAAVPSAGLNGKFQVSLAVNFGFPPASETTTLWDTIDIDSDGAYNAGTGVYTVPNTGLYIIYANITLTGAQTIKLYDVALGGTFVTATGSIIYSAIVYLTAASHITANVISGANGSVLAGSWMAIVRMA